MKRWMRAASLLLCLALLCGAAGAAVLPEAQHRGIAGALMRHMISLCRQRGKQGIILTCKEEKISFYQGFGFQCRGKSDSCHGGVIWYDMILPLTDLSV